MKVDPIRDREDVKRIKQLAEGRNKILLEIGFNTGLRISDILEIKVKDIFSNSHINLQEQKTNKTRKIKLNSKAKELIRQYIDKNNLSDNDFIFQSRKGENSHISKVQAYRIIKNLAKKAGIKDKVGTHSLRKTFGYHHYKKYKDITMLQEIFNHDSPKVTKDYIGITQEEIDQSLEDFYL
jgi:site-specific recombinase XerD